MKRLTNDINTPKEAEIYKNNENTPQEQQINIKLKKHLMIKIKKFKISSPQFSHYVPNRIRDNSNSISQIQ